VVSVEGTDVTDDEALRTCEIIESCCECAVREMSGVGSNNPWGAATRIFARYGGDRPTKSAPTILRQTSPSRLRFCTSIDVGIVSNLY